MRFTKLILPFAFIACGAAGHAMPYDADILEEYVVAFDDTLLTDKEIKHAVRVAQSDDLPHFEKVMRIHDLLQRAGALRHVDMHHDTVQDYEPPLSY